MEEFSRWFLVHSSFISSSGKVWYSAGPSPYHDEGQQDRSLQVSIQYLSSLHEQEKTNTMYNFYVDKRNLFFPKKVKDMTRYVTFPFI